MENKTQVRQTSRGIGRSFIGTSGWQYKHWRLTFFPDTLKVKDQFIYYRSKFTTVELNASFYHVPAKTTFGKWAAMVEQDFVFSVKANRFITHSKKLQVSHDDVTFFLNKATALGNHLGPILFQLPPGWKIDTDRLERFLKMLPKSIRATFEFRNPSWYHADVYSLLEAYGAAFCMYDLGGHFSPKAVTAPFVYMRLHGPGKKYQGSYQTSFLEEIAREIRAWQTEHRDVYVYFDNDMEGYAPLNASMLKELLH